jgi:hypothetical protein
MPDDPSPQEGHPMSPRLPSGLCYDEGPAGFSLYLGEVSTSYGLALFDASKPLAVVRFGATGYGRLGWATEKHLPPLPTAGAARAFLDEHEGIGLIEFEARLGDDVWLASHNDGECHLRFRERPALMAVLQRVVPPVEGGRVINALLANPGHYVRWDAGTVRTFPDRMRPPTPS